MSSLFLRKLHKVMTCVGGEKRDQVENENVTLEIILLFYELFLLPWPISVAGLASPIDVTFPSFFCMKNLKTIEFLTFRYSTKKLLCTRIESLFSIFSLLLDFSLYWLAEWSTFLFYRMLRLQFFRLENEWKTRLFLRRSKMSRIPFSSYLCVLGNNHQNLKILPTKWPIQNLFFFILGTLLYFTENMDNFEA